MRNRTRYKRKLSMVLQALVMTCVIFGFTAFLFYQTGRQSEMATNESVDKGYITYEIQYGDTLYDIAKKHASDPYTIEQFIHEVSEINSVDPDRIMAGGTLILPVVTGGEGYADDQ